MPLDWTKTLLLWDPRDPELFDFDPAVFAAKGINTLEVPYDEITSDNVISRVKAANIEAVIFTRNDDMPGRPRIGKLLAKTGKGYTTVSAIDPEEQNSQTRQCIADLLAGRAEVEIAPPNFASVPASENGTFSLIFDFEQFGCARYAMPRLLPLLEAYGVRATFFATGFIAEVYPEVMRRVAQAGHEIAIHGQMHEFLAGRSIEDQVAAISAHFETLSAFGTVKGANYIFRMDGLSPAAMAAAGVKYFVHFRKHLFYRTRYFAPSTRVRKFVTRNGDLNFIPVGAETYEMPRAQIETNLRNYFAAAGREGPAHINVLMHPFKDGAASRIADTKWLIEFLIRELRLGPMTLGEISESFVERSKSVHIGYRFDEIPGPRSGSRDVPWHSSVMYHAARAEAVAASVENHGKTAVFFCADDHVPKPAICIFPDYCGRSIAHEPLVDSSDPLLKTLGNEDSVTVVPGNKIRDWLKFFVFHTPRTRDEWVLSLRKVKEKLKNRLLAYWFFS
jgi:peptidoglycan/xylan/chitin deacetylase (PgdA/CDA1 family)